MRIDQLQKIRAKGVDSRKRGLKVRGTEAVGMVNEGEDESEVQGHRLVEGWTESNFLPLDKEGS